jgi:hypothetical protein
MNHFHKLTVILQGNSPSDGRGRGLRGSADTQACLLGGGLDRSSSRRHGRRLDCIGTRRAVHSRHAHRSGTVVAKDRAPVAPPDLVVGAANRLGKERQKWNHCFATVGHFRKCRVRRKAPMIAFTPPGELLCAVIGPTPGITIQCVIGGGAPLISNRLEPAESENHHAPSHRPHVLPVHAHELHSDLPHRTGRFRS